MPAPPGPVIRLVQPNADQSLKWQPDHAGTFFRRHLDLTAVPPGGKVPDLIVWPETAVPFLLEEPWDGLERMVAAAGDTPVAFGVQRSEGLRGYNSLAVLGRDAAGAPQVLAVYDKHHLVPFGEFIPGGDLLADWLSIPSFAPKEGYGYSAGPGPALLDLGPTLGRVLPLICYEAVFAYFPRAVDRPGWMLQVTNDAWFGDRSGPFQHLALNRLRSIETGLPLVRVANTGPYRKILPWLERHMGTGRMVVTADDDTVYPQGWLARLLAGRAANGAVTGWTAHPVVVRRGRVAGYGRWFGAALPEGPALRVLPIGKDGVLYAGTDFPEAVTDVALAQRIAPTADDLWLRWHMARAGVPAQAVGQGVALPEVARGGPSLWRSYNRQGGNDAVVAALEAHFAATYGWTMAGGPS